MHSDMIHSQSRYFNRSQKKENGETLPNYKRIEQANYNNCHSPTMKSKQYDAPKPSQQKNTDESLKCVVKCDSIQKNFQHKDELDLHMIFYHGAVWSSDGPQ